MRPFARPRTQDEYDAMVRRLESERIIEVGDVAKLIDRSVGTARRRMKAGLIEAFCEHGRWRSSVEAVGRYRQASRGRHEFDLLTTSSL